jgi:ABC-2 type transport system ATP-binding protein
MSDLPVEVRGLVKRYGPNRAVDGVDLTVEEGDIYGYLGPNGAGKTTTLRMMLGLVRRDGGSVKLFGRDPADGIDALAQVAGFVEAPTFYPYLTGRDNLAFLATLDGGVPRRRLDEVLDQVGLLDRSADRVGTYSLGMRQRLGIAASLMRSPKLLVLDEPANGLDPAGMRDLRALVSSLPDRGVTVLYSSHLLSEVEEVCNRVAIVNGGKISFEGRLDELRASFDAPYRLETGDDERALVAAKASGAHGARIEKGALWVDGSPEVVDRLTVTLGRAGIPIRSLVREQRTLEDLFFRLTEEHGKAA